MTHSAHNGSVCKALVPFWFKESLRSRSDHPLIVALEDRHAVESSVFIIDALARRLVDQESRERQKHLNSRVTNLQKN